MLRRMITRSTWMPGRARLGEDDGQAVPLMAALAAVVVVAIVAVAGFVGDVVAAQRARTAADAAALAAVGGGRPAAVRFATTHGGALVEWSRDGREVTVTVRVGDAVATARATGGAVVGPPG